MTNFIHSPKYTTIKIQGKWQKFPFKIYSRVSVCHSSLTYPQISLKVVQSWVSTDSTRQTVYLLRTIKFQTKDRLCKSLRVFSNRLATCSNSILIWKEEKSTRKRTSKNWVINYSTFSWISFKKPSNFPQNVGVLHIFLTNSVVLWNDAEWFASKKYYQLVF